MAYSIGQVAQLTGLSTHTLRYYDKYGLLPKVQKNSAGLRRFTEDDLNLLNLIECLKSTGLKLKDIRHYIDLMQQGERTLSERYQIFLKQKQSLLLRQQELLRNMEKLDFKIRYYKTALKYGEANVYKKNKQLASDRARLFAKF
ncbi:MAG: MerR family transcriptional regulator [Alphaproteobacteria bacterium]|nr:MerR family transcriptional regulator [Alphaproteobacteria bacterium]